jgi:hypothetical protein
MSTPAAEVNVFSDTNRMVHVIGEVLLLGGLGFYVFSQTRKLNIRIEELVQKLEEKDQMYSNLENTVQQLSSVISQLNEKIQQHDAGLRIISERINTLANSEVRSIDRKKVQPQLHSQEPYVSKKVNKVELPVKHQKPVLKETPAVSRVSKIQFKKPVVEEESSDDEIVTKGNDDSSDSDLDNEISKELAELEESFDSENDSSLKKQA